MRTVRFGASFAGNSLSIAQSTVSVERQQKKFVWAELLVRNHATHAQFSSQPVAWSAAMDSISEMETGVACRDQFIGLFGTHYVKDVFYSKGLVIEASVDKTSNLDEQQFRAKLSLALAGIGGEFAESARTELEQNNITLRLQVFGALSPSGREVIVNLADVQALIADIRANNVTITPSADSVNLGLLSNLVNPKQFPNVKASLKPDAPASPESNFGVPKGTVIAWYPSDDDKDFTIVPTSPIPVATGFRIPKGWTLCDGSLGVLNLTDRFIRGSSNPANMGFEIGSNDDLEVNTGSANLSHEFQDPFNPGKGTTAGVVASHSHPVLLPRTSLLPLSVQMAYLIKT
jgi:hypothetical protein